MPDPTPPSHLPKPGFYYHYKHDPEGPEEKYAYELLNVGLHTEERYFAAIYRPLYEDAYVYKQGRMYYVRPLGMFMETVTKEGREVPRFARITDPELIERLIKRRDQMYP